MVYRFVALILPSLIAAGCAPTWKTTEQHYRAGRYEQAERGLTRLIEKGDPQRRREARSLLDILGDERRRAIIFLLEHAEREEKRAVAGDTSYRAAGQLFSAALDFMTADDRRRDQVKVSLERLAKKHRERVARYREDFTAFEDSIRRADDCMDVFWSQRIRALSASHSALGGRSYARRLRAIATRASERCFDLGDYDRALELAKISTELPEMAPRTIDARFLALAEVRREASPPYRSQPLPPPLLRSGEVVKEPSGSSRSSRRAASQRSRGRRARELESRFSDLYQSGDYFAAFTTLDAMIADHPQNPWLLSLRRRHERERRELIDSYLAEGETALQSEQPELAFQFYSKVLVLDRSNDVARDRKQKIENLRTLKLRREKDP